MKSGVYKIVNKINGRVYVGSSITLKQRRRRHLLDLKKGVHRARFMQRDFDKCGFQALEFTVIEEVVDLSTLLQREQHWMDTLKPVYNTERVAGSSLGVRHSKEIIEANRLRNSGFGNGNAKLTDELVQWGVDARKSMTVAGIAFALGVHKTSLQRAWKRIGLSPLPQVVTIEWRERARQHAYQTLLPSRRKPIARLSADGRVEMIFKSLADAAQSIGSRQADFHAALNEQGGRTKGKRFAYVSDLPAALVLGATR